MNYGSRRNGLDPYYAIVAWEITPDGYGWVDLESVWKRYGKRGTK